MFKELFTEELNVTSKGNIIKTKRYEVVYVLDGEYSKIEIFDWKIEKVVVEEMEISEEELHEILKKYKLKAKWCLKNYLQNQT